MNHGRLSLQIRYFITCIFFNCISLQVLSQIAFLDIFKCLYADVVKQNSSHVISNFVGANSEEGPRQTAEVKCSALLCKLLCELMHG